MRWWPFGRKDKGDGVKLADGSRVRDPRLDALVQFDERSRGYAVSHRADYAETRPRSYTWSVGPTLDQGQEGACVGFAHAHRNAARPTKLEASEQIARSIYRRAQQIDEWPGEEPTYSGTSILAGTKASQEMGYVDSYWWAFTLEEFLRGMNRQPCVAGLTWYWGMVNPGADGRISPTGEVYGRHAILINRVKLVYHGEDLDYDRSIVGFWNSWGPTWGDKGTAWMTLREFDQLRREQGELCFAIDKRTPTS